MYNSDGCFQAFVRSPQVDPVKFRRYVANRKWLGTVLTGMGPRLMFSRDEHHNHSCISGAADLRIPNRNSCMLLGFNSCVR